eukprot:115608-Pleurochrysis_carterae.AAC.1
MRIALQPGLGLPLSVLDGQRIGGPFGDLAVINKEQISTRHAHTLHAWFAAIRVVHGASAVREPPPLLHTATALAPALTV